MKKKKKEEEAFAAVAKDYDDNGNSCFIWMDSRSKTDYSPFVTVEDAINDIPKSIRKILVQYIGDDKKSVNYVIDRDAPQP